MARKLIIAGAQTGGIDRATPRSRVVERLLALMRTAKSRGADLVVFPELALTTFFPRWWMEDQAEIDSYFETEMPGPVTQPLFDTARELGIGFYIGYGELTQENGVMKHYNSCILIDEAGAIVGRYRKVHLPGHAEHRPEAPFQHLEKRYFDEPAEGFGVWNYAGRPLGMAICNDRRWPETYRVMALKGAELVLIGYNTPAHIPWAPVYDHLGPFHNHLVMQAGAYQNAMYVVGVAKAGMEDGFELLAGSCIVAPSGEVIAMAQTNEDEVFTAACDLDQCRHNRMTTFNFARNRQVRHYGELTKPSEP